MCVVLYEVNLASKNYLASIELFIFNESRMKTFSAVLDKLAQMPSFDLKTYSLVLDCIKIILVNWNQSCEVENKEEEEEKGYYFKKKKKKKV